MFDIEVTLISGLRMKLGYALSMEAVSRMKARIVNEGYATIKCIVIVPAILKGDLVCHCVNA